MLKRFFKNVTLCFIFGILAGFLSLVFSSIASVFFPSLEGYFAIFALVVIEESIKFAGLSLLLKQVNRNIGSSSWLSVFQGLFFGAGFGIFELALIYLSSRSVPIEAWAIVVVHVITSMCLVLAIYLMKMTKKESLGYFFILLAVLIHMWYNTSVTLIAN